MENYELLMDALRKDFSPYSPLRPEDKIRLAMRILYDVLDSWDHDRLLSYPADMPSFDEYLAEIETKLYDIQWQ